MYSFNVHIPSVMLPPHFFYMSNYFYSLILTQNFYLQFSGDDMAEDAKVM